MVKKINSHLAEMFNKKFTENGDIAYTTTGNTLLDILFMTEYFQSHLSELPYIGTDTKAKLFAMFMRDARKGMGRKDIGRILLQSTGANMEEIVFAGRYDDLWKMYTTDTREFYEALDFLKAEIEKGNELAKKWMPRYSSKNLMVARVIAKYWGMNKQQYGHFIKVTSTVENKLSSHMESEINFAHVPSLASIKYAHSFATKETTKDAYKTYMEEVKNGTKTIHTATSTPYDILHNVEKLDMNVDTFFEQLKKVSGNWIPVVDTSGSMFGRTSDAAYKAMAIGHYLAKTSNYAPNKVISFSSKPQLLTLGETPSPMAAMHLHDMGTYEHNIGVLNALARKGSQYAREILSMYTGDISRTDFGAVMQLLREFTPETAPQYLVVLSDMEFDAGSKQSKDETMDIFARSGIKTKIVWWNFNNTAKTCPEVDSYGNIYISGYNPMLLQYLEAGFDGDAFLDKLLEEYSKYKLANM